MRPIALQWEGILLTDGKVFYISWVPVDEKSSKFLHMLWETPISSPENLRRIRVA